jgi:hypothetical protein
MYLSGSDQQALRGVLGLLARDDCGEREIRERLGHSLLSLLRADQFASFVWNAERGCFGSRVAINMEPANLTPMTSGTNTTIRSPLSCSRAAAPPA